MYIHDSTRLEKFKYLTTLKVDNTFSNKDSKRNNLNVLLQWKDPLQNPRLG